MKWIWHYLRHDWLHWRWLLIMTWILLASAALFAGWIGQETAPTPALSRMETAMQTCWLLAGCGALTICVLIGHASSPVSGASWTLTRPRRSGALAAARCVLGLAGIALPAAAAHGLSLLLLDFTAGTVLTESGMAFLTVAAAAPALMLWAFVSPAFRGFLAGFLTAGALSGLWLLRRPDDVERWLTQLPPAALTAVILTLPAVAGYFGIRRRTTPKRHQWNSVRTGVLTIAALTALPMISPLLSQWLRGPLEREVFPDRSADFEVTVSTEEPQESVRFSRDEAWWQLAVHYPPPAWGQRFQSLRVDAVAFRTVVEAPWSAWIPAYGWLNHSERNKGGLIEFRCRPDALPDLSRGELRLRSEVTLKRQDIVRIPFQPESMAAGEGWTGRLVQAGSAADERAGFSFLPLLRTGFFTGRKAIQVEPDWNSGEALLFNREYASYFRTPMAGFLTEFRPSRFIQKDAKATPRPLPDFLRITVTSPVESFSRNILVRDVSLIQPVLKAVSEPAVQERWRVDPPVAAPPGPVLTPRPWTDARVLTVPDAAALETEVAVFLHSLMGLESREWSYERGSDWWPFNRSGRNRNRLAVLAGRHLPLFLEALVRGGGSWTMEAAIIAGCSEERRDEILRRIPECQALVRIAEARGWEAEAKPHVLRLAMNTGSIPDNLFSLCRSYRDPAFHPFMRRQFRADLPTVRYWQSMPDLAAELPSMLAVVRERVLRNTNDKVPLEALLVAGDAAILDRLLAACRTQHADVELLRRWIRLPDGEVLSENKADWEAALGERTAADFVFNAERQIFVMKTPILKP